MIEPHPVVVATAKEVVDAMLNCSSQRRPSRFEYKSAVRAACDFIIALIRLNDAYPRRRSLISVSDEGVNVSSLRCTSRLEHSNRSDADSLFRIALARGWGSHWTRHQDRSVFLPYRSFFDHFSAAISVSARTLPDEAFGRLVVMEGPLGSRCSPAFEPASEGGSPPHHTLPADKGTKLQFWSLLLNAVAVNMWQLAAPGFHVTYNHLAPNVQVTTLPYGNQFKVECATAALQMAVVEAHAKGWVQITWLSPSWTSFLVHRPMIDKLREVINESVGDEALLASHVIPQEYVQGRQRYLWWWAKWAAVSSSSPALLSQSI